MSTKRRKEKEKMERENTGDAITILMNMSVLIEISKSHHPINLVMIAKKESRKVLPMVPSLGS